MHAIQRDIRNGLSRVSEDLTISSYRLRHHCRRGDNFQLGVFGFFLNNLRRHVTPQINISLILDRHPLIISVCNNPTN